MAVAVFALLLAGSAIATGWLVNSAGDAAQPTAGAARAPVQMPAAPVAPTVSEPAPRADPGDAARGIATDDRGFVDSQARCDPTQRMVALGRTQRSFVVICGHRDGRYEYRGQRLSDAASLTAAAVPAAADAYLARNAGAVYAVSATELVVTAGGAVVKQEPMIEFRAAPAPG